MGDLLLWPGVQEVFVLCCCDGFLVAGWLGVDARRNSSISVAFRVWPSSAAKGKATRFVLLLQQQRL